MVWLAVAELIPEALHRGAPLAALGGGAAAALFMVAIAHFT
jgi:hypothetical protein